MVDDGQREAAPAALCPDVYLFHDEELPPERAAAFVAHLPGCGRCRSELRWLAEMDAQAARVLGIGRESAPMPPIVWLLLILLVLQVLLVALFIRGSP